MAENIGGATSKRESRAIRFSCPPCSLEKPSEGLPDLFVFPSSVLSLGWTFARIYPVASSNDHLSNDSPLTPSFLSIFKIKIERRIEFDICCNVNSRKLQKIRKKNLLCTLLNLLLIRIKILQQERSNFSPFF